MPNTTFHWAPQGFGAATNSPKPKKVKPKLAFQSPALHLPPNPFIIGNEKEADAWFRYNDFEFLLEQLHYQGPITMPKRKFKLLKVGTDAEVFLYNKHGAPVPVCGLVGGTKDEPKPVPELGEGFAVQEDNVMLEFNVPASDSAAAFSENIQKMLDHLRLKMAKQYGLTLALTSAMKFEPYLLTSPAARTFGCEPDYCVWTRTPNEINKASPVLETLRTAAAHLHVSFTIDGEIPNNILDIEPVVKALDFFVGAPGMHSVPTNLQRRDFYGRAGAFRPKPYGVEYRVLGNEWISSVDHIQWVFNRVEKVMDFLTYYSSGTGYNQIFAKYEKIIDKAINGGNASSIYEMTSVANATISNLDALKEAGLS